MSYQVSRSNALGISLGKKKERVTLSTGVKESLFFVVTNILFFFVVVVDFATFFKTGALFFFEKRPLLGRPLLTKSHIYPILIVTKRARIYIYNTCIPKQNKHAS